MGQERTVSVYLCSGKMTYAVHWHITYPIHYTSYPAHSVFTLLTLKSSSTLGQPTLAINQPDNLSKELQVWTSDC